MNIKISANVTSAVRGMKKVGKEANQTNSKMKKLALGAAAVAAAYKAVDIAVQLTTASFKKAGSELAVLGDRLAKQARMVGVTAEQYQVFEFAAERSGTSITAVSNGLKKLGRVMVDARNGSRQIKETFEALGIELMKGDETLRDVNDVFMDFADRAQAMGESAERTGVLMLLLGRSGTEMANMMSGGREGIEDMRRVLERLNSLMGKEFIDNSELFVDAQADLKFAARGLAMEVGNELIPAMTGAMQGITDFIVSLDGEAIGRFLTRLIDLGEGFLFVAEAILGAKAASGEYSDTIVGDLRQVEAQISSSEDRISSLNKSLEQIMTGKIIVNGRKNVESALKAVGLYSPNVTELADAQKILEEALKRANLNLATQEKAYAALREEQKKKSEQDEKEAINGQKLKQAISGLAARREANKKLMKGEVGGVKELMVNLNALARTYDEVGKALYESFYKTPETELIERWSRENDIISRALHTGDINYKESMRLRAIADKALADGKLALVDEVAAKEQEAALAQAELQREQFENQLSVAGNLTASIGSLFSALSQIASQAYERGDEEAKKHAIALFHISQAFALATATVNTALSVSQALATPPAPNIPLGLAAGIAGAAEIATIVGASIAGIGDAGLTSDMMKRAGLNNHSAIVMRNDETLLDPVGTKHITEMLAIQKAQMQNGGGAQTIRTTVELDGRVLGESVDNYLIRQQERGLAYGNRVRQEYV